MKFSGSLFLSLLLTATLLTGCGAGNFYQSPTPPPVTPVPPVPPVPPVANPGPAVSVVVQAGSTPVAGASVQLYAAGTTGSGSAATALLTAASTSDATGTVQIAAGYTCPSAASNLYAVSRGGTGVSGSGVVLVSALGACNSLATSQKFVVDEATTVAAAYAFAPFYTGGSGALDIGASSTNATGMANAFTSAAELTNPANGTSPGSTLPANVTLPTTRINSLANAVNACVQSSSVCSTLFAAATPSGGSVPANTFDALYNVVRFPANNVAALYQASTASSVYGSALTAQPTDWTLFLTISGSGMNSPSGIGVDSTGSVWAASYFSSAAKFTPLGAPVFPNGITGGGLNNSFGLAMDQSDNAWITNEQPVTSSSLGSVSKFSPSGASLAGGGFTAGGIYYPNAVAIDPSTTAWVVDYGNSYLTLLNANGTPLSGASGYTSSGIAFPVAIAIDANHYGWIANQYGTQITRASADGKSFTNVDCCNLSSGIAVDQANNVWVTNFYGDSVSLVLNNLTVASNGYKDNGGINRPQGIAIDGAGTVWIANVRAPYLSAITGTTSSSPGTPITPATGYGADAQLLVAYALAIDASGNIWVTNFGSDTVTKFIGLAAPVKTPLSGPVQQP